MAAWKAAILNGFRVVLYTITFISSCGTHQTLSFPKNSNPVEMPGKAGEGRVVGVVNLFPFYQDGRRRNWYVGGSPPTHHPNALLFFFLCAPQELPCDKCYNSVQAIHPFCFFQRNCQQCHLQKICINSMMEWRRLFCSLVILVVVTV